MYADRFLRAGRACVHALPRIRNGAVLCFNERSLRRFKFRRPGFLNIHHPLADIIQMAL